MDDPSTAIGVWRRFLHQSGRTYLGLVADRRELPGHTLEGRPKAQLRLRDVFCEELSLEKLPVKSFKRWDKDDGSLWLDHPKDIVDGCVDPAAVEELRTQSLVLIKLPTCRGMQLAAWIADRITGITQQEDSAFRFQLCYQIVHDCAKQMDEVLKELQRCNHIQPGESGPGGHLRKLSELKRNGDLLQEGRMARYKAFAKERNEIMHNLDCRVSYLKAVEWLRMLGLELLPDSCEMDSDDQLLMIRDKLERLDEDLSGTPLMRGANRMQSCERFVGRGWLFQAVAGALLRPNAPGAVLLQADGGFGKSAFMDEVCLSGGKRLDGEEIALLASFAIKFDEQEDTCDPSRFVLGLAKQLEAHLPAYAAVRKRPEVQEHFKDENLKQAGGWTALLNGVFAPLKELSGELPEGCSTGVMAVDGLDEALTSGNQSPPLLQLLAKAARYLFQGHVPWLRLLLTSRRGLSPIDSRFRGVAELVGVSTDTDKITEDLVSFLAERCEASEVLLAKLPEDSKDREELVRRSAGNFQWLRQALLHAERYDLLDLSSLTPGDLPGLYLARFETAFPGGEGFADLRPVLEAVLAADPPLKPEELFAAASLSPEASTFRGNYEMFKERFQEVILFLSEAPNGTVGFQHESIAAFLQDEIGLRRTPLSYGCRASHGHTLLAGWMLLRMSNPSGDPEQQQRPLMDLLGLALPCQSASWPAVRKEDSVRVLIHLTEAHSSRSPRDQIGVLRTPDLSDEHKEFLSKHALHWAAQEGHEAVVRLLLESAEGQKANDINAKDKRGRTTLHWAARRGHVAVVRLLLEGAGGQKADDINAKDNRGWTALHLAAGEGNEAVVLLLLEGAGGQKADINAKDNGGCTSLDRAAQGGQEAVVRLLLKGAGGQKAADINAKDCGGWDPLHLAAGGGHEAVVRLLLEGAGDQKADINTKDGVGWTALHRSAKEGHKAVVRLLLEGAGGQNADIDAKDKRGWTALHWAAKKGHKAVVRLLLEGAGGQNADINAKNDGGRTALHLAAGEGNEAVVLGLLLEGVGGQKADINTKDGVGWTALHRSAKEGHEAVVRLLMEGVGGQNADINALDKDNGGLTALHMAAKEGRTAVVRLLLEGAGGQKADINAKNDYDETALDLAARGGHKAVFRLLLEGVGGQKADINAKDSVGLTALHRAAKEGNKAVVRLLLEGGGGQNADINAKNDYDETALDLAAGGGHKAVFRVLLEGAVGRKADDINAKDSVGLTALHRAAKEGNKAVVRLLLEGAGGQKAVGHQRQGHQRQGQRRLDRTAQGCNGRSRGGGAIAAGGRRRPEGRHQCQERL